MEYCVLQEVKDIVGDIGDEKIEWLITNSTSMIDSFL
jgi:hypothetical protein